MKNLSTAEAVQLESLVDRTSLKEVVGVLSDIARDKAMHIRDNWQDEPLARSWDKDAGKLERCSYGLKN
jgi:hypothetical protein